MANPISIYGLNDPTTGECRYIGQTFMPKNRVRSHHQMARSGKISHLYNWFRQVQREQGQDPKMQILGTVATREMANVFEKALIEQCRAQGVRLTNDKEGGLAGEHSIEARKKMSLSVKAHWNNPDCYFRRRAHQRMRDAQ